MKKIALSGKRGAGKFALVDDNDFERLNKHRWHAHSTGYAVRNNSHIHNKCVYVWMHREIMNTPSGMKVDHIDREKLNNQKINLRNCTHSQNLCNVGAPKNNTTGYKGVTMNHGKTFCAKIQINKKMIWLGIFKTKEEAALAYNEASKKHHGKFAFQNIIKEAQ